MPFKLSLMRGTALAAAFMYATPAAMAAPGVTVTTTTTIANSYTGGNGANGANGVPDGVSGSDGDPGVLVNAGTIDIVNDGNQTGGDGGNGGDSGLTSGAGAGNGGKGGAGGAGAALTIDGTSPINGDHVTFTNNNGSILTGGTGGLGGQRAFDSGAIGASGAGGSGLLAASDYARIFNSGTIIGGNGTAGRSVGNSSAGGAGGDGGAGVLVQANDVAIVNNGTISGGMGASGGVGTDVLGPPGGNGAAINIEAGSGGVQLTNAGSGQINGSVSPAIFTGGTITTLQNDATITGVGGDGIYVDSSGQITNLNNTNTITTDGGVAVRTNGTITTLNNAGTISSTANGQAIQVLSGTISTLHNDGGTISTYSGVSAVNIVGSIGTITNNGGTITTPNGYYAVYNQGGNIATLNNNNGSINNNSVNTAAILNFGTIFNPNAAVIDTFSNNGGTVENASGTAFQNEGLITTFNNNGGTITGGFIPLVSSGTALYNHDGAEANGHIISLTNDGGLIATTGADPTAAGIRNDTHSLIDMLDNTGGIIRSNTGSAIDNAGTIGLLNNGANGLITIAQLNGRGVNNTGTIATLSNAGEISTGGGYDNAVYNNGTISLLTNTNLISTTDGRAINNDTSGFIDTMTNNGGTISSQNTNGYDAFAILNGGIITSLNNTGGTISTQSGAALVNDGTISMLTNGAGGTISADVAGYAIRNRATGIIGDFSNSGTISALDATAISNEGTLLLNNSGTITAANGVAIDQMGGTFGLINSGTISATAGGVALQLAAPVSGIIYNMGGTISSAGTFMTGGGAAVQITQDVGNLTIMGGTVSVAGVGNGIRNFATQTGTLTLHGVAVSTPDFNQAAIYNQFGTLNVVIDSATTVTGNVVDANGTMNVTNSGTVNGIVGDLGGTLSFTNASTGVVNGDVTLDGSDTLTLNGGTINGNITLDGGTNAIIVNSAFTTGGTILGTFNGGSLTISNGGDFTANNAVDLDTGALTVASGGRLELGAANVTTAGALTNNGTIRIGNGRTLSVGSLAAGAGTLDYVTDSSNGNLQTGVLNVSGGSASLASQTVHVSYIGGGNLNPNTRSLIATGTGAATLPTAAVTDNSFLYDFAAVQEANNIYLQLVAAQTPAQAGSNANNRRAGAVLLGDAIDSTDPQIAQIRTNLANAPTSESYNRAVEATEPTVDNGNAASATAFTSGMFDLADGQLAIVNTGDVTGVASGDQVRGLHPWVQGFGGHADQDERSSVAGYQANTYGLAVGVDTRNFDRNTVVGLSFGYGRTHVNSENANNTNNDVDTYQVMAYGNRDLGRDYFVTAMGAFGWNENDQTRYNVGGVGGLDADADYHSWQAGARASVGRNFRATGRYSGLTITPSLVGEYVHYDQEGYTETGAGGANLNVNGQTEENLSLGGELRAAWMLQGADGTAYKPDLHAGYKYNVLNNDRFDANSSFAAGGGTFNTNGLNPSNSTYNVGAGMRLYSTGNWDFTASYDYTFKPDYNAHSGFVRAAYEF